MLQKILVSLTLIILLFLNYNLIDSSNNSNENNYNIEVSTTSGLVRGQIIKVLNKSVKQFLSIPFAEPPIGELRFARPKPIVQPLPVSSSKLLPCQCT